MRPFAWCDDESTDPDASLQQYSPLRDFSSVALISWRAKIFRKFRIYFNIVFHSSFSITGFGWLLLKKVGQSSSTDTKKQHFVTRIFSITNFLEWEDIRVGLMVQVSPKCYSLKSIARNRNSAILVAMSDKTHYIWPISCLWSFN